MKECLKCKKPIDAEIEKDIGLCTTCVEHIASAFDTFLLTLDSNIREKYNIHLPENFVIPVQDCSCKYNNVIVFDYHTEYSSQTKLHHVVLSGVCRGCMGYRRVFIDEDAFPFHVRNVRWHSGVSIIDLTEKKVDYIK